MVKATKAARNAPVAPAPVLATVPVAPAPAGQPVGKATKGAHHIAACTKGGIANLATVLTPTATLQLTNSNVTVWKNHSDGHCFFVHCLLPLLANGKTATVQQVVDAQTKAVNKGSGPGGRWRYPAINHLRWLYTNAVGGLLVNGQPYAGFGK